MKFFFMICAILAIAVNPSKSASISDLIDELENYIEQRQTSDVDLEPVKASDDFYAHNDAVKATNDCADGTSRHNINAANINAFDMNIVPNYNSQEPYKGLEGAKHCKVGENIPNCNGDVGGFVTFREKAENDGKDKLVITRKKKSRKMLVRRVCMWTFGILNVHVRLYKKDGSQVMSKTYAPFETSEFFWYGCIDNRKWLEGNILEIDFENSPPTHYFKKIYAEVCW